MLEKKLSLAAQLPRTSGLQKTSEIWKKICPWQRSCPGQVVPSKKNEFWKKETAPGRAAAPDKWFLQKKAAFWKKVLPLAAQLPRTSGSIERKRPTAAAKRAWSAFSGVHGAEPLRMQGVWGAQPPRRQGGVGGRSPPAPLPRSVAARDGLRTSPPRGPQWDAQENVAFQCLLVEFQFE